jgi:hypothetical protein
MGASLKVLAVVGFITWFFGIVFALWVGLAAVVVFTSDVWGPAVKGLFAGSVSRK